MMSDTTMFNFSDESIDIDQKTTTEDTNAKKNVDLLNFFLSAYNLKYKNSGNMFDKVDAKDPTATNDRMELFYRYMTDHRELQQINPELCDCYDQELFNASQEHEIYALVVTDHRNVHCVSHSYMSLLSYIYDQLKGDHLKIMWNIIRL